MISDTDRSYYIGASDTKRVVGRWNTKTFMEWWQVKQGLATNEIDNIYLQAGNAYERLILDHLEVLERDRQIIIGRLRVNLDGEYEDSVVEVKTFGYKDDWTPPKAYINQVNVEMFATGKTKAMIAGYGLTEEDYCAVSQGETLPIDPNRLKLFPVDYDEEWINNEYLPRLWYLARCLDDGTIPTEEELKNEQA